MSDCVDPRRVLFILDRNDPGIEPVEAHPGTAVKPADDVPILRYICLLKSPALTCSSTSSQDFRPRDDAGRSWGPERPICPDRIRTGRRLDQVAAVWRAISSA
jgi:hypothetical protein